MKKIQNLTGLVLLAVFLSMQTVSAQHMAHYGFEKHDHKGMVCGLYIYNKHIKCVYGPPSFVISELSSYELVPFFIQNSFLRERKEFFLAYPRAPPAFL